MKTEPVAISEQNIKENKELAKLQLFGAGPKMRGLGIFPTDGLYRSDRAHFVVTNSFGGKLLMWKKDVEKNPLNENS